MLKISVYSKACVLVCGLALAPLTGAAQARGFTVLHSFVGGSNDGAGPLSGVLPIGKIGFYVATDGGGSSNRGTLTLIRKNGTSTVLHSFTGGSDGQNADGMPLKWSDDNIYGTTQYGGSAGCGTVYRFQPSGSSYKQLYAFQCGEDDAFPFAGLTDTGWGQLVGPTYAGGGPTDSGGLFAVNTDGSEQEACGLGGSDGAAPYGKLLMVNGSIYFATSAGTYTKLGLLMSFNKQCFATYYHTFTGSPDDGATPYGSLVYFNNVLYGTTSGGGTQGLGTVFKINPDGSNYSVLYNFQGIYQNADGSFPHSGLTVNTKDNMLYGTTINGGKASDLGTIFKIDPSTGAETVVHAFSGSDGAHPYGDLYIAKGKIYGTTAAGGASNEGVLFRLKS